MPTPPTIPAGVSPNWRRFASTVGLFIKADKDDVASDSPALFSGAGAPAVAAPLGSLYINTTDGSLFNNIDGSTGWASVVGAVELTDPGDATAIPVTSSFTLAITSGAGGETNTLAAPTFLGQEGVITFDVDGGGDRVITVASAINVAGNTIMTFATARQTVVLKAIQLAGVLAWELVVNNGTVVLS